MILFDLSPEEPDSLFGMGPIPADYVVVVAAPSKNRPAPLRNQVLGTAAMNFVLRLSSRSTKTFYVTSLVKIPQELSRKVPRATVRKWYPKFLQEMRIVKPRRILAMGIEAAETLCPGFTNMREDHGTLFWNPDLQCHVIATETFRRAMYDSRGKVSFLRDVQRMLELPDPEEPKIIYFDRLEGTLAKRVWLDIETTGLALSDDITRVGLTGHIKKSIVWEVKDPTREQLLHLREKLIESESTIIGHNLQFDLARMSWKTRKDWILPVEDTLVRGHVMGERGVEDRKGSLSLKHQGTMYTNRPGPRSYGSHKATGSALDLYLAEDVLTTRDLYLHQEQVMGNEQPYILQILNRLLPYMVSIQMRGVFIDRPQLQEYRQDYLSRVQKEEKKLRKKLGNINLNAAEQLGEALIANGVPLTVKTETGQWSTAEAALMLFKEHPLISRVFAWKDASKNLQFLDSYLKFTTDEDPYLRPRLLLTSTETGRLSGRDPNPQQVPRVGPIKRIYKSRWPGGKIGLCDLSQAELRIVALLSGDPLLIKALLSEDVHRTIASLVYGLRPEEVTSTLRKRSKGVTFGLLYGGKEEGLAERTGSTVAEVREVLTRIFSTFKHLNAWINKQHRTSESTGRSVTLFGRVRDLTYLFEREGRNSVNRKATNTPVQSLASDTDLVLLLYVCTMLWGLKAKTRPFLGVHDSILFDIYPGEERMLAEIMLEAFQALNDTPLNELSLWGKLPMAGELIIGESWAHVESTNEAFSPERIYPLDSSERTTLVSNRQSEKLALKAIEEKVSG